jgi:hypothetical protein
MTIIVSDSTPAVVSLDIDPQQPLDLEGVRRVLAWNREHRTGTSVQVWQSLPAGKWLVTYTTGPAFLFRRCPAVPVAFSVQPIYLRNLQPLSQDIVERLDLQVPRRQLDHRELALPAGDR